MVILGFRYDSWARGCNLDPAKVSKYTARLLKILTCGWATSKELERVVGNLQFAAWVEPFGRPLLSFIAKEITPNAPRQVVPVTTYIRIAMQVRILLMQRNRGLQFCYILNR